MPAQQPASADTLVLPGGRTISASAADAAADWLTLFMSDEATAEHRQQWLRWRESHADHEAAWRHIETVTGRLKVLEPRAAYSALTGHPPAKTLPSARRRAATHVLLWGGLASGCGLLASRSQTWAVVMADHRTATGERRSSTLDDGTQLTLNTATAVRLQFDGKERRIHLVAGEILVATRHGSGLAPDPRPLLVETAEGHIRSLGTRFTVRQLAGRTEVAVLESAVEITPVTPDAAPHVSRIVHAGEKASFGRGGMGAVLPLDDQVVAWSRGQLVADDLPLAAFLEELGRYRHGVLRADARVASLRLSGVFPLADTDRILATLPNVLPVQLRFRTRFWVTLEPAD